MNDLRFAVRQLAAHPTFSLAAILTLGLGIGATTSVFSVVEAVLLRSLPYASADRLVLVWQHTASTDAERVRVPAPDVVEYRERARSFDDFAFTNGVTDALLAGNGEGGHARIGSVTDNFFSVLGVQAQVGRLTEPGEAILPPEAFDDTTRRIPPSVLVLGHELWSTRFGGDSTVVGRTVQVNGQAMTIVGVAPSDFALVAPSDAGLDLDVDAWTPLRIDLRSFRRDEGEWRDQDSDNTGMVIGRLRPDVTLEQARAEMASVAAQQRAEVPFYRQAGMRLDVVPIHSDAVQHARTSLLVLLAIVGIVLLVACLNVANLLLVRVAARRRELVLRSALGARRGRLLRQAFIESGVLAAGGVAVGLVLASWGVVLLVAFGPADLPRIGEVEINGTILAFTLLVSLSAVALFGGVPAMVSVSDQSAAALRLHGSTTGSRRAGRLRRSLVVSQVAMSLVLLIAAGLLLRSFARLQRVDPGFDRSGVLTFNMTLPAGTVGGPGARAEFMRNVHDRIAALPGVEAAGLSGGLPLAGDVWTQPYGFPPEGPEEWGSDVANFRVITSDYFRTMGTRVVAGRAFTPEEDVVEQERVVIVDAALARHVTAGDAVGTVIGFPLDGRPIWARIVGVVENVRHESLREDGRPTIYVPYRQEASRAIAFAVRVAGEPLALVQPIRQTLAELSGNTPVPVYGFRSLERYVQNALASERFALLAVSTFAGVAFLLAVVGLYGVVSYGVSQRLREIGVRVAVGAQPRDVLRDVVGGGLKLVLAGVAIGIGVAAVGLRLISGLLFEVPATDPTTYAGVSVLLVCIALAACYLPARRAAALDPMQVLRYE